MRILSGHASDWKLRSYKHMEDMWRTERFQTVEHAVPKLELQVVLRHDFDIESQSNSGTN